MRGGGSARDRGDVVDERGAWFGLVTPPARRPPAAVRPASPPPHERLPPPVILPAAAFAVLRLGGALRRASPVGLALPPAVL